MLTQISAYTQHLESLLAKDDPQTPWPIELSHFEHLLSHLQHERLIHLLVTLTVGLATLISTLVTLSHPLLPLIVLDAILGTLFLAYIIHYRRLENSTQSCYPLLTCLQIKIISLK